MKKETYPSFQFVGGEERWFGPSVSADVGSSIVFMGITTSSESNLIVDDQELPMRPLQWPLS